MRFLFGLLVTFPTTVSAAELWLGVGDVRSIGAARGAPIKVGSRGLLRVIDGDRSIRIVALKPGETTLVVGERSLAVRILSARQRRFVVDLRLLMSAMRGLELDFNEGRPEIGGTLLRFSDWQLIADLARRTRGAYGFRARVMRDVGEAAIARFSAVARDHGFPLVRFSADPEFAAVLPGSAAGLQATVAQAFAPWGIDVRTARGEMQLQPLVKTRVVLAEVSRARQSEFGIRWPTEYSGQVLPEARTDGQLLLALRALEARGHAQVLASPDLSCRSGGEAHFHAGGEIPIRISSLRGQNVVWKNFGVLLNVRPRADFQGSLSLEIKTEISMVDFANAVDGVPAIKKNVVESQFDLPGRRTIALSGLIRRDLGSNDEGVPLLSAIPLLGRLFSSRRYQRHQSDLVVFVTPEIVNPAAEVEPTMPPGWSEDAE